MAAACLTLVEFRTKCPAFADDVKFPDDQVQDALDEACCNMNLGCWGVKLSFGHKWYTAHIIASTMPGAPGASTQVKRKRIDKIETEKYQTGSSDEDFNTTTWGQQYVRLRDSLLVLPVVGRTC